MDIVIGSPVIDLALFHTQRRIRRAAGIAWRAHAPASRRAGDAR